MRHKHKVSKYFEMEVEPWMPRTIERYRKCVIGNERVYAFGIWSLENHFRDYGMVVSIKAVKEFEELDPKQFGEAKNLKALDNDITFIAEEV